MTRVRRALPALAAGLGVIGAATVLAWSAWGGSPAEPVAPPLGERAVSALASVSPAVHFVGDRVIATMELTLDRARTNPDGVAVVATFAPYSRVGPIRIERRDAGSATVLRYTYALQCVDRPCLARASGGAVELPEAIVSYASPLGQALLPVAWPALTPLSRLAPGEPGGDPSLRPGRLDAPAVSYRVDPQVAGWLLASLSAAVALGTGFVLARRLRPAPAAPVIPAAAAEPRQAPLDEALDLVERAAGREEDERRAALDRLARALETDGLSPFGPRARRLAWSRQPPGAGEMTALAGEVRAASRAEGS